MKVEAAALPQTLPARPDDAALHRAAEAFEAAFLAEMLKPMGAGAARQTFGGGIGEEQYGSLLVGEEARAMAHKGGIGLAESIFQALKARADAGAAP